MVSHHTISGQITHLSGQTIFGQTNLSYIIGGEVIEFTKEKQMSGQCLVLTISTAQCAYYTYSEYIHTHATICVQMQNLPERSMNLPLCFTVSI